MQRCTLSLVFGFMLAGFVHGDEVTKSSSSPAEPESPLTPLLQQACGKGDFVQVKALIGKGAPINGIAGNYQCTALHFAISGKIEIIKYLIAHGANLDVVDIHGSTPLSYACYYRKDDAALLLLDAGANPNVARKDGQTPLMYAAGKGDDVLVTSLIQHHANINATGPNDGPAIRWAVDADKLSTLQLLLDAGADMNVMTAHPPDPKKPRVTVLSSAAATNDFEMIDLLLAHGADINGKGEDGTTPLLTAAVSAHDKTFLHLLAKGADIDAADARGETALTYLGDLGNVKLVRILKAKGAKRTDLHIIAKEPPPQPLPLPEAWALAVGAIYAQTNGDNFQLLGYGDRDTVSQIKTRLKDQWEVTDKASFIAEVESLQNEGQRIFFQEFGSKFAEINDLELLAFNIMYPRKSSAEKEIFARDMALRSSYLKWQERSGLAWDMCRCANLINWGYSAGYVDEKEAWDLLLPIARKTQAAFGSWREMSNNFLDGRQIWAGGRDPQFELCSRLLQNAKDPNSPWTQLPWQTDLGQ